MYAPDSFAPPIQEAILLNPTCTYPKPGGVNASASALEWNKSAIWSEARAEFAAALTESVSPPLPVTVAVTKGYAVREIERDRERRSRRRREREDEDEKKKNKLTILSQNFQKQKTRKKKQIDRAVTSALAEGYTTLREPATLSNNNGKPFNATLQKMIGKVSWVFVFHGVAGSIFFIMVSPFLLLRNDINLLA